MIKSKTILTGNQTVLFQGDSITDCGRNLYDSFDLGTGYPAKVAEICDSIFPSQKLQFLNRGISGNRTGDLLDRYEKDFVVPKPDLISILIGINDTWRRYDEYNDPTSAEVFEANYRRLLENIKKDLPGTLIVIIEPFLLETLPEQKVWREDLDPKIHVTRYLAEEFADIFIPLDGIFASYLARGLKRGDIAGDGVHPSLAGHGIIAAEWLKALGMI